MLKWIGVKADLENVEPQPQSDFDHEYRRLAPVAIVVAICAGFLVAGGELWALPLIALVGVVIVAGRLWISQRASDRLSK